MALTLPSSIPDPLLMTNAPRIDPLIASPDLGRGWSRPTRAGGRVRTRVPVSWELSRTAGRDLMLFWRAHADAWIRLTLRDPRQVGGASEVLARFAGPTAPFTPIPSGWAVQTELELA